MKFLNWLCKAVIVCMVVTGVSVYTTWYTVNAYLQDLSEALGLPASAGKPFDTSRFLTELSRRTGDLLTAAVNGQARHPEAAVGRGSESGLSRAQAETDDQDARDDGNAASADETDASAGVAGGDPRDQQPPVDGLPPGKQEPADGQRAADDEASESRPEDAVAVWSQTGSSAQGAAGASREAESGQGMGDRQSVVISAEDLQKKKDLLTDDDKVKIFSLLVTRLPQEEMQKISIFVEGGITGQELEQIEGLVAKHLKPQEFNQLMEIIDKYDAISR